MTETDSPSERYRAFKNRQAFPDLTEFVDSLSFPLDDFQREACEVVARGASVLVAAPTGAGKTIVGEYAIHHAFHQGEKAFYTTPIKALSNQKFQELRDRYGDENVGLLTGDTSINSHADIVVMTTEVLRNMIYAGSRTLDRLGVVVLDEVHYLADKFRGSVWEEVIVHLNERTALVGLSATVSNAEEFGAWMQEVRGNCEIIVSERRPVPLWPHVMLREGLFDLYGKGVDASAPGPKARINAELEAITRRQRYEYGGRGSRPERGRRSPPRFAVVDVLDQHDLLPAIVFVFSRAGCEDAVDQVNNAGIVLTTPEQRDRIAKVIDDRTAGLPAEDLRALQFDHWRDHLMAGIAAHHAGMIPLFKEVVEDLFKAGLCKVVYATETLALGINMPARSVVLEKLVKWDGTGHVDLSAGEYTQLTGRAGRRGIDIEGHAVIVEHPGLDVQALGRLASRRTYPLNSSFQPSYNMAINLVRSSGAARAREMLEMSFAQYQADQAVVGKARRVRSLDAEIEGFADAVKCSRGDFMQYAQLRERITRMQKGESKAKQQARRDATADTLKALERGAVVKIGGGKRAGLAVVVTPDQSPQPRPSVVTAQGRLFRMSVAELHHGLEVVGTVRVAKNFDPRNARSRKDILAELDRVRHTFGGTKRSARERKSASAIAAQDELLALGRELKAHPCHGCPDREQHARWAERYFRAQRDRNSVAGEISKATQSVARVFDKRCAVLLDLNYLDNSNGSVQVTEAGLLMRKLYSENDLVIAECLSQGVWEGLSAPELAAAISSLLYNGRREDNNRAPRVPGGPQGRLASALDGAQRVWVHIDGLHTQHSLPALNPPQFGIVGPIHAWASGNTLARVLKGTDIAPGDMVRWCKQVIDSLEQVAQVAPQDQVQHAARDAIKAMRRGVVAY